MVDYYGYFAITCIALMFVNAIIYYYSLIRFMRSVIRNEPDLWADFRKISSFNENSLSTAYKILLGVNKRKINCDDESTLLAKLAIRWLYITMCFFMIFLFFGLLISINK